MDTCMISIIVAMGKNRVIGKSGHQPWHLKSDLRRFAEITKGHSVIMGRKTAEAIMLRNKKPLPERRNILITRNEGYVLPGFEVVYSLEKALAFVKDQKEAFIIGGGETYSLALSYTQRIYLTEVDNIFGGDTFFPKLDLSEWKNIKSPEFYPEDSENEFGSFFSILERKEFVNLDNARVTEQMQAMERILASGNCPFCLKNILKEHKNQIIREGKHWIITENQWKYEEAELHLLFILKQHAEKLREINPEAGSELIEFAQWTEEKFGIRAGGLVLRFGDINLNGATVAHLHFHLIVPKNPKENGYEPVRFRIGGR